MRINTNNVYGNGAGNLLGKGATKPLQAQTNSPHLDKIELSRKETLPARELSVMDRKNEIVGKLAENTDSARLDSLKERVQNDLYYVASEDIASAMLGTLNKLA